MCLFDVIAAISPAICRHGVREIAVLPGVRRSSPRLAASISQWRVVGARDVRPPAPGRANDLVGVRVPVVGADHEVSALVAAAVAQPGSKPFALKTRAAGSAVKKRISAAACVDEAEAIPVPAEKTVKRPRSAGNGPTSSAPATGTISDVCPIPSSALPLATSSAACAPGTRMAFGFICSLMPRRSSTSAK